MTRARTCAWIPLVVFLLAVPAAADADEADRQLLADRLQFVYIEDPNTAVAAVPAVLDNAAIMAGTETGSFWTSTATEPLQRLVRRLLREPSAGGDDLLQYLAARVIGITPGDRRVFVYLFNDLEQDMEQNAETNWGLRCLVADRVWPCAGWRDLPTVDGVMYLGSYHMRSSRSISTFIHELVHTRDRSDGRAHLFTVGDRTYRYGADGTHYGSELIPNRAMTYKEGIANALRLLYHPDSERHYFDLFALDDYLWVETATPPAGSGIHPDAWLHRQLEQAGVSEDPVPDALRARLRSELVDNYASYRFRSLPPRFMMHNEYVLAMILSKYAEYVSADRLLAAIGATSDALYLASGRGPTGEVLASTPSGVAVLFEILGNLGLPDDMEVSELQQSYDGPNTHLLPLAFVDYFTAYRTPQGNAEAFAELFENALPRTWIDAYVIGHQRQVRAAVPAAAGRAGQPSREDLTDVAIALGITLSTGGA